MKPAFGRLTHGIDGSVGIKRRDLFRGPHLFDILAFYNERFDALSAVI